MLAFIPSLSFLPFDGADIFIVVDVTAFGSDREQAPLLQSTIDPILQEGSLLPISGCSNSPISHRLRQVVAFSVA